MMNVKASNGRAPVHIAAATGNLLLMETLLDLGANYHLVSLRETPFSLAIIHNRWNIFEFLLNKGSFLVSLY